VSRRVVVEADGGSRGNPGPAGYGAVVRDEATGEVLAEVKAAIGIASNNVAEYRGLIAGLTAAADLGADSVDVRMDSKLVVEQMCGRWQVKHPAMRELRREAQAVVDRIPQVAFRHIPRAQNSHADRLANEAMDAAAGIVPKRPSARPTPSQRVEPKPPNRLAGWSTPPGPPTTTVLLRHGQTPLSVERRFSGLGSDPALSDVGRAQARAAATRVAALHADSPFAAVWVSPLRRTQGTAAAVSALTGLEPRVHDGLRETDWGEWEGHTFAEVQQRWPAEVAAWLADPTVAPPGGEAFATTATRVASALADVLAEHPEGRVLLVTHVTPIKVLHGAALGLLASDALSIALYRTHVDLCGLTTLDWYPDGVGVVRGFNEVGHLAPPAGEPPPPEGLEEPLTPTSAA
jgi:ribonuclease H / adenosylcobalamin/alpha-ribazole phosphatase